MSLVACPGADAPPADGTGTTAGTADPGPQSSGEPTDDAADSGSSSSDDDGPLPPPDCTAPEVACGQVCADLQTDPSNCGMCGLSCVVPQASATCVAGQCGMGACDPGWSDCDGELETGCEAQIDCTQGQACETTCGSTGTQSCEDACASASEPLCVPPVEVCNVMDDNCDGACDEGAMAGCRVGVHRSNSGSLGHFYTTDLAEAQSGDLSLEAENFFWLYSPGVEGLQPLFRCIKGNGKRLLTTAIDCEFGVAPELTVGFISAEPRCGSIPLYRLRNAPPDAHFYTTSAAERDNAVNNLGFIDEGIAGHVWTGA